MGLFDFLKGKQTVVSDIKKEEEVKPSPTKNYPGLNIEDEETEYLLGNYINGTILRAYDVVDKCVVGETYYVPYGITTIENIKLPDNVKKLVVPSTVKEIEENSVCFSNELEEVQLSEGLKIIGKKAFMYCKKLTRINFPNSLKRIDDEAFRDTNIEEAIIGDGVKIGSGVFDKCNNLYNLRLPADIEEISDGCCSKGINKIPKNVKRIGTTNTNNISYYERNNYNYELYLPKTIEEINITHDLAFVKIFYEGSKDEFDKVIMNENSAYYDYLIIVEYNYSYEYESKEKWHRIEKFDSQEFDIVDGILRDINTDKSIIEIPEGVKHIVSGEKLEESVHCPFSTIKEIKFPKSLKYTPTCLACFENLDISKIEWMNFDYLDESLLETYCDYNKSNIFPENIKYIDILQFYNYGPVLAFANKDTIVGDSLVNTAYFNNLRYMRTLPSIKSVCFKDTHHLEVAILEKGNKKIIIDATNDCVCIKELYIPNTVEEIVSEKRSSMHVQDLYYDGNEEQWNALMNSFKEKHVNSTIYVDNYHFEKYDECEKYTIEELRRLETEIGFDAPLPKEPITSVILVEKPKKEKKTKAVSSKSKATKTTTSKSKKTTIKNETIDNTSITDNAVVQEDKTEKVYSREELENILQLYAAEYFKNDYEDVDTLMKKIVPDCLDQFDLLSQLNKYTLDRYDDSFFDTVDLKKYEYDEATIALIKKRRKESKYGDFLEEELEEIIDYYVTEYKERGYRNGDFWFIDPGYYDNYYRRIFNKYCKDKYDRNFKDHVIFLAYNGKQSQNNGKDIKTINQNESTIVNDTEELNNNKDFDFGKFEIIDSVKCLTNKTKSGKYQKNEILESVSNSKETYECVTIPNTIKKIGKRSLDDLNAKNVYIPGTVVEIEYSAFENNLCIESVYIDEGIKLLGNSLFKNCTNLKYVSIPSTVDTIDDSLFFGCTNLKKVDLRGKIRKVMKNAFSFSGIEEFVIPEGSSHVEERTFDGCVNLKKITIPKSVVFIGLSAFKDTGLKEVVYEGTDEDWNSITISNNNKELLNVKPQKGRKKSTSYEYGVSNVKVKVKFEDGKSYYYNCAYKVSIETKVKVQGAKENEVGTIIEIAGPWDKKNKYMKEVTEIIKDID